MSESILQKDSDFVYCVFQYFCYISFSQEKKLTKIHIGFNWIRNRGAPFEEITIITFLVMLIIVGTLDLVHAGISVTITEVEITVDNPRDTTT